MYFDVVEESEFASEADDGENDGALICLCVLFFNHRKKISVCSLNIARAERDEREMKTNVSFLISRSKICVVFGNEGF